jgi:IclR family transcriptional regulator, KDG regulon repressor
LLAWRERWREAVLAQPLETFTERTTVGPESLRRELGWTLARGYSVEDREYHPDTRGLAAPVLCETGEAVAALAVVAPVARLPAERYRAVGETVVSVAESLSAELGWTAGTRSSLSRSAQSTPA